MSESRSSEVERIVDAWARERPETDVSSILVVTPMWRLTAALQRGRIEALAAFDLDQSRLSALGALRRAGPPYRMSIGELTRRTGVTAGATTQRVDKLERAGFVRRVQVDDDRRTMSVQLTDDGSAKLDEVFDAVMRADEASLAWLDAEDRAVLERILGDWMRAASLDRPA